MQSFEELIKGFRKENFLDRDLAYLEDLILSSSSDELYEKLPGENWFLWNEKGKLEDLILTELYNLEINFKIHAFEVAICRRISILQALDKLSGRSLISLGQAFRLSPPQIMIEELIKPVDQETLDKLAQPIKIFGNGNISEYAKEVGNMNCICVNEHDEVLYHWLKARNSGLLASGHILVHFDAHSDMLSIKSSDMSILKNIEDIDEFKNYIASFYFFSPGKNLITPVDLASFIYYAVSCDLIREIFWIYPDPDYCKYRMPANLERCFLLDIDGGENFRLEGGHVVCDWTGIKVHILRLEELPIFNEEVIVDIDMDFFLNQNSADGKTGCRGYRVWSRETLDIWQKICGHSLKKGDLIPWVTVEQFSSLLKARKIFSPITTIALSPFFTCHTYHFLMEKLKNYLSGSNLIF